MKTRRGHFDIGYNQDGIPILSNVDITNNEKTEINVYSDENPIKKDPGNTLRPVLIDSGAAGTVVGITWLENNNLQWKKHCHKSNNRYTFGSGTTYPSRGTVFISLPVSNSRTKKPNIFL